MIKKYKTSWNFNPLYKSINDPEIAKKRKVVEKESYKFINKWKKRTDYLKSSKTLKTALNEYERWARLFGTIEQEMYYFNLQLSLDLNNSSLKARFNKVQDLALKIRNDIQFLELNIAKIDPKIQKRFLNSKDLVAYRHFLEKLFLQAKYLLTEPEERIVNLKSPTSYGNWIKMLSGFLSKEERKVIDEDNKKKTKNLSQILGLMNSSKKKVRDSAAKAFNEILASYIYVAENELNSILQNKKTDDELRKYDRPDKARHINDDIDTEVIDTLVEEVTNRFNISKRYYKLKAQLLKVEKLQYHERNVEYGKIEKKYSFKDSSNLIDKALSSLDKDFVNIFRDFLINGQVDVYPRKGKRSGAFCTHSLKILPSYILLNHTDKLNDVLTFAHELGHGISNELVRKKQNALNFGTPISTAEVASTFIEDFVLQELIEDEDDELRLAIMMMKLNSDTSSIFRQIAFYNFEKELHLEFKKKGYLSHNQIGNLFKKHMSSYMGDYVEQSDGSENWWIYVVHFRYYFYVYSYSSGLLISKSLQASVKENPNNIENVKEFLASGLSNSPKKIFANLNIDITKKAFWNTGLNEIEALLNETEQLASKLNKI